LVSAFCRRGGDDGAKTPMRVDNWLNMYKYHARGPGLLRSYARSA
jgi:hypothetical protein